MHLIRSGGKIAADTSRSLPPVSVKGVHRNYAASQLICKDDKLRIAPHKLLRQSAHIPAVLQAAAHIFMKMRDSLCLIQFFAAADYSIHKIRIRQGKHFFCVFLFSLKHSSNHQYHIVFLPRHSKSLSSTV